MLSSDPCERQALTQYKDTHAGKIYFLHLFVKKIMNFFKKEYLAQKKKMPVQHFEKAGSLKLPEAHTSNEGTVHLFPN